MGDDPGGHPPLVPDRMVILGPDQAELIVGLLNRLQLLLRFGGLDVGQLRLLVDGESAADPDAEAVTDAVSQALDPLRCQLDDT